MTRTSAPVLIHSLMPTTRDHNDTAVSNEYKPPLAGLTKHHFRPYYKVEFPGVRTH
jgi:hypothetical protein